MALAVPVNKVGAQAPAPPESTPSELIVRLTEGATFAEFVSLLVETSAVDVEAFESVDGLFLLTLPPGMTVSSAGQLAKQLDGVAYAEPNYIVSTQTVPNDPSFSDLWALLNTGQSGGTAGVDIDAVQAWDITTGSSNVVVAVLDTGIDYTHPDLAANMFRNEADCNTNGIDDDGNLAIDDCYGIDTVNNDSDPFDDNNHGTHVAGTIGAVGNNGVGVTGVNWNVKLMACKFLGAGGSGATSDAVRCLDYVARMKDKGFDIVATNNSWTGGPFSQALTDAIDAQRQRGILFIAAAGNSGFNNDVMPTYPGNTPLPNVIAVASTTRTDALSSFSNYGRRKVLLGAPGSEILSTTPNNTYSLLSGTSMATPHVTGVAALLKAQDPNRTWQSIRNAILAGGENDAALTANTITGKRLNALGALTCSNSTVLSRLEPIQSSVTGVVGSGITLTALHINCATGNGDVTVTVSPGSQTLTLVDNGAAPDQFANDGIYSGSFVPGSAGDFVLTFPNAETVSAQILSNTSYVFEPTAFSFRTITGANLNLSDDNSGSINPPFRILFGGGRFDTLFVSSNGSVNLNAPFNDFLNTSLPTTAITGALIAQFWDDLIPVPSSSQNVFWEATGTAPNRELVIEWRDVPAFSCTGSGVTFQMVFFERRARVLFNYLDPVFGASCAFRDGGGSATIGIQTAPTVSRQFSMNTASVPSNSALLWSLPGTVTGGTFTDESLTAGMPVRAVHINELRVRINAVRKRFGLLAASWTDSTIVPGATAVRALHLSELRTALSEAYVAAGLGTPSFTDSSIQSGVTIIKAAHVIELREAVMTLEGV